jgi:hypothetical protein
MKKILTEIAHFLNKYQKEIVLFVMVILVSLLSFAAGYIVAKQEQKEPIRIERKAIFKFTDFELLKMING